MKLFTLATLITCAALSSPASGQQDLSLTSLFMVGERAGESRLWFVVTNSSDRVRVLCRRSWDYSLIPDADTARPDVRSETSLHGCGDDDHDPLWIVRPGQSRIDSVGVDTPASRAGVLSVAIELEERLPDSPVALRRHTLEWHGRLSEAIANFERLDIRGTRDSSHPPSDQVDQP